MKTVAEAWLGRPRGGDQTRGKAVFLHQEGGVHIEENQLSFSLISHSEINRRCSKYLQASSTVWDANSVPGDTSGKEPACQCRRHKKCSLNPWVGTISWRKAWQPTPVFLPGESHGQRSLAGYSPWGLRESDMTEVIYHAANIKI